MNLVVMNKESGNISMFIGVTNVAPINNKVIKAEF